MNDPSSLLETLRSAADRFRAEPYGDVHVGRELTKVLRERFGSKAYYALRDCQYHARTFGDPFIVSVCAQAEKFMIFQLPPEDWAPERKS